MLDGDGHVGGRARCERLWCRGCAPTPTDTLGVTTVGVAQRWIRVRPGFVHHTHLLCFVALVRVRIIKTVIVGDVSGHGRCEVEKCSATKLQVNTDG